MKTDRCKVHVRLFRIYFRVFIIFFRLLLNSKYLLLVCLSLLVTSVCVDCISDGAAFISSIVLLKCLMGECLLRPQLNSMQSTVTHEDLIEHGQGEEFCVFRQ